jgi:hypothetical protein
VKSYQVVMIAEEAKKLCERDAVFRYTYWTLTEEFAADLGGCLSCEKQTACCLRTVIDVFQIQTLWAEVQSCFVRVR